ncbi:hypothetical protein Tsubulata_025719 [Turnera subulata]|uniref:Auxin-responsive protein n=1 Tax=Turnera subulata TaxID=218843 RepID=A0A9Q0FPL9_9ROSI|nr:hypothetical protein Tsubulata_025719 [Turnera subulata]
MTAMSLEKGIPLQKSGMDFKETELTLGLPGDSRLENIDGAKTGTKRSFLETVDLSLGGSTTASCGNKDSIELVNNDVSSPAKPPQAKMFVESCKRLRSKDTAKMQQFFKIVKL